MKSDIKNKIIVIGGNHHNTLGLIRSVGELGYPVCLFLEQCVLENCNLRYSKYISSIYYLQEIGDILKYLHSEFNNEYSKPIILCGSDASISLLDSHFDELKDKFYIFNASLQGRINIFMHKSNMFPVAEVCGLKTIKTWHVSNICHLPTDITYPCLTKPNNSLGGDKEDIHICRSLEELKGCLREGVDYLIQEYIEKDYELDINAFAYNHGEDVFIPATVRKIRDYTYRQSDYIVLEDLKLHPQIDVDAIKRFVAKIGYEGLFSIEFLCKKDKAYFLEINMRNDGCGYLYTKAGANYPSLWLKYVRGLLSDHDIENSKCKSPVYLMQHADFSNVIHHQITFNQWIKDLFRTRAFFVLSLKDPTPFLYVLWMTIKLVLRKLHILK